MPEEQAGGLPGELEAWLSHRTSETGRDAEEELARAVATYRLLDDHDERLTENGAGDGAGPASLDTRLDRVDGRLGELSTQLERHESATESHVTDLRERVIQVLQTAQSKADADHAHESLDTRLSDAETAVADLETTLDSLSTDLTHLDQQVEGGFENFEVILEGLADSVDDAERKLDTLAGAIVDLRRQTAALEAADAQRTAAEALQAEANREGVGAADCEQCGGSVDVALLGGPRCPHCEAVFTGLDPGRRFFGRASLTVGDRPALEGGNVELTDPEDVFENDE
jgi:chromosome segregation ATPase